MTKTDLPKGYKKLNITQPHIAELGPGYYKKEDDKLVLAFYVDKQNCNATGNAHGGMLMAIADYALATTTMKNPKSLVVTVSFHSEFIQAANLGELLEVRASLIKEGKSLGFARGQIKVADRIVLNFGGVVKKL